MPAILDLFVSNLQAAGHGTQPINYDCGRKNRFFTILATNRLCTLYLPHQPATTAAGACCRNDPTQAVWTKVFNWGLFFPIHNEKNFF